MGHVIGIEQRDKLFSRIAQEPGFRDMMKEDWRAAVKEVGIDPELVVDGVLTREEVADFARQRAAWTITIVIFARELGLERIAFNEAVNFARRA